jgi:uncharacterized heparinase superfamily protein
LALTAKPKPTRPGVAISRRLRANVRDGLSGALDSVRRDSKAPELLLIPQDLRTADPSLYAELAGGTMGLAGATADIRQQSPFRVTPPSKAWQAALLGFSWLGDLRAAQSADAQDLARRTVRQWIAEARPLTSIDWTPAIAARRLMSWLTNANLLVEGAPAEHYDSLLLSCDRHMVILQDLAQKSTGMPRLMAQMALVMGALCMTDQEARLAPALKGLGAELGRQVQQSGMHVSRNPAVLVELMLDLLPLKQCFNARSIDPPAVLLEAMRRITPMLRHLQLGDRGLARFHGMSATELDKLATVLSYDGGDTANARTADLSAASRYFRLRRRNTVLILDGGMPPPPELSGDAGAGALSFEMSSGGALIIVNAGAPGPADGHWRVQARGTAAHSTLVLNETASSRLVQDPKDPPDAPARLLGPTVVDAKVSEPGDGAVEVKAQHNGYQDRYGMLHGRIVTLGAQGDRVSGVDRIHQPQRLVASNTSARAFAIHFHLHPQVRVEPGDEPDTADLTLRNGETWRFTGQGAKLSLEDSLFFANFSGPVRTVQIVLRGNAREDTQVRWTLERLAELPEPSMGLVVF